MQEGYIKVLQTLARMEAKKMPMISPRDIATDFGEDEQYVSDILEVLENRKDWSRKRPSGKGMISAHLLSAPHHLVGCIYGN